MTLAQTKKKQRRLYLPFIKLLFCLGSGGLLFQTPASAADQSAQAIRETTVESYQQLLREAVNQPTTGLNSIFYSPRTLSEAEIEIAIQSFRATLALSQDRMPETIQRIQLLAQIARNEPISSHAQSRIHRELEHLREKMVVELDRQDKKRNESFKRLTALSAGFLSISCPLVASFLPTPPEMIDATRLTSYSLLALGLAHVSRTLCTFDAWDPSSYRDSRDWQTQLRQVGQKIDNSLQVSFGSHWGMDSRQFPPIPHYSLLLNHVASQLRALPQPSASPLVETTHETTLAMPLATPQQSRVDQTRQAFRDQTLRDGDLKKIKPALFRAVIQTLCDEINQNPYALWSQLALRRLFFLSLQRKDPEALAHLMKTNLKSEVFNPMSPMEDSFGKAFLLGISQDHIVLTQTFLELQPTHRLIPCFLSLVHSTLQEATTLAQRRNHPQILSLIQEYLNRTQALHGPTHRTDGIVQTASHNSDINSTLGSAGSQLVRRYQDQLRRSEQSIIPILIQKLDQLQTLGKLTPTQTTAAKDLLTRINEAYDPQDPRYEPNHLFLWNTAEKKQKTTQLLHLAYLALEDDQAFEQLNGKKPSAQDKDDNWTAWILNALVDSGLAYAIDGGRREPISSTRSVNSCVAGVDNRILHGLSGLHPDVAISSGSAERSNLLTWERAATQAKEQKKAAFFNSVFSTLLKEWAQERPQLRETNEVTELVTDYQSFVKKRAIDLFGALILNSEEFKTILDTITDFPEQLLNAIKNSEPLSQTQE